MRKLLWIASLICCVIAFFIFNATVVGARSAPQEAAGMSMALAVAIIPYVAARAWDELTKK